MERVGPWAVALILAVGALNVAFSILIQKAALISTDWREGILSWQLPAAFIIGCTSLAMLFALYSTQIHLGRAILLMGAVSILGGTAYGFLSGAQKPDAAEYALLIAIGALFAYRAFLK